jgi:tagaturonate reductase
MAHPQVGRFVRQVLLEEIAPTVEAPGAAAFAAAVLERFRNPYVHHALIDITLHGTTKLRVRIVPTLVRCVEQTARVPEGLAFGVAAHLLYLRGDLADQRRAAGLPVPMDELGERVRHAWRDVSDPSASALLTFVEHVLGDSTLWECDLRTLPRFPQQVAQHLSSILRHGVEHALDVLLTGDTP